MDTGSDVSSMREDKFAEVKGVLLDKSTLKLATPLSKATGKLWYWGDNRKGTFPLLHGGDSDVLSTTFIYRWK